METNNQKKKLVVISGITGGIGNAFLAKYSREDNTVIYGISRKASSIEGFTDPKTGKLFTASFIANIGGLDQKSISNFIDQINFKEFESIIYVHCLGLYPFEINSEGKLYVENDKDGDGINDMVLELSHRVFKIFVNRFSENAIKNKVKLRTVIFGGIADIHKPLVHQSWWRVMEMTQKFMRQNSKDIGMNMINISSVVCSHEIVTRPHVFTQTDADMRYWLLPHEIADRFFLEIEEKSPNVFCGYHEYSFYNIRPSFDAKYYENYKFTPRKVSEIYHK